MSKIVWLQSSNNEVFEASECMVTMSKTIQTMIHNYQEDDQVVVIHPLENVDSGTLAMVREWCENHVTKSTKKQCRFVEELELETLLLLRNVANYMGIKELGDHMREAIFERLEGMHCMLASL